MTPAEPHVPADGADEFSQNPERQKRGQHEERELVQLTETVLQQPGTLTHQVPLLRHSRVKLCPQSLQVCRKLSGFSRG